MFNPLQLQPRALLQLSMNGWALWTQAHLGASFRALVRDHAFGVVVGALHIDYLRPLRFIDCDAITAETGVRARRGGRLLELQVQVHGQPGGIAAARVRLVLMPLKVEEVGALSAVPQRLPDALRARLAADEIDEGAPERPLPALLERCARAPAAPRARREGTLHRHLCETADQWSYIDVPVLAEAGREVLVQSPEGQRAGLGAHLGRPLVHLDAELRRPYFYLDPIVVESGLATLDGAPCYVHKLGSPGGVDDGHGVVLERF